MKVLNVVGRILYTLYETSLPPAMIVVIGAMVVHANPTGIMHILGFILSGGACVCAAVLLLLSARDSLRTRDKRRVNN